ncbi:MAG: metal-dependent hydrolase [Gammaproteobacteria bacterium]|nr:metal-dependent hydrolase [Gammaproteobacteria bacterium]
MDPLTQGTLGAALPESVARREKLTTAAWLGCLSGMAPDLDILIRSNADPLLFLEYHRQFTHAFIFIPVGALICALLFYRFARHRLHFREVYGFCLLGYATHGLLDTCTTYGTQLLWPFTDARFAWNNVSVVDPAFSAPLLALVIAAAVSKRRLFAQLGLAWAILYLLFGVVQRERAEAYGHDVASARGLEIVRLEAKPGFANLFLWKIVTETENAFHVDAIRLYPEPKYFEGDATPKLDVDRDLPWLDPNTQQARDLERFRWFSNRYLAMDRDRANHVIDIRYSMVPNSIDPLWGIQLDPNAGPEAHVEYVTHRTGSAERLDELIRMLVQ